MEERVILFNNRPVAVLDGGTDATQLLKERKERREKTEGMDLLSFGTADQPHSDPVNVQTVSQPPQAAEEPDYFEIGFNEGYEDTSSQKKEPKQQEKSTALWDEYFKTAMLPDSPAASFGYQFGNQQTKAGGVMAGSGMDYAGQLLSAAGTVIEGLAEYLPAYGPYQNEIVGFNPSAYIPERDTTLIKEYVSDPLREKGAKMSADGQAMVQAQKEGLGKFGQFAVDLGSAGTQMLMDIGLGVATGGGMAIPAAIRTFGSSAEKAAANGAELNEQLLYAGTSAALSYGIENVCNVAFSKLKAIAPGISDDLVTEGVEKLAQKLAKTPGGANALKNIGMAGMSGLSEGVEETVESLLDPVLQRLTYDKNAETVLQNPKLLADAAYEGLIGGVLGVFGGGASTAVDLVENMIYDGVMPGEKLLAAAGASESEALGAIVLNQMGKADDAADVGQVGEDIVREHDSGADTKMYSPVEYKGTVKVNGEIRDVSRRVYQRRDIDFDYSDGITGMSNLERMQAGKPPIGSDGHPIQLHHILQVEKGPVVEIREVTHQQYYAQLHGLIEEGSSFRNDPILNKQYNNFRYSYWKWRAEQILGGDKHVQ